MKIAESETQNLVALFENHLEHDDAILLCLLVVENKVQLHPHVLQEGLWRDDLVVGQCHSPIQNLQQRSHTKEIILRSHDHNVRVLYHRIRIVDSEIKYRKKQPYGNYDNCRVSQRTPYTPGTWDYVVESTLTR